MTVSFVWLGPTTLTLGLAVGLGLGMGAGCAGQVEGELDESLGGGAGAGGDPMSPGPGGQAGSAPNPGPASEEVIPPDIENACKGVTLQAAAAPVRRLTRREYNNTIRDLLSDASNPGREFA